MPKELISPTFNLHLNVRRKKKKSAFRLLDLRRVCRRIGQYTPVCQQRKHSGPEVQRNPT